MVSQFRKSSLALLVTSFVIPITYAPITVADEQQQAHEHDDTEVITVTASPLERTALESSQPITVLAGDELREQQAHTLGETLASQPGINATHFAGVASSPIVRGLDGPRVKVLQNGLDSGDVSRGSPDHAVTTETTIAEQIEIFRGPATLLYGSGAIGGVVNVVDNRIAREAVGGSRGYFSTALNSASQLREGAVGFSADHKDTVWHVDAFKRRSDDYHTPHFVNDEGESTDHIDNSFIDAQGANVGVSYLFAGGYVGASYGRLEQTYGIPGHAHGHDEHAAGEQEEAGPFAAMWQNRIQLQGAWNAPFQGFSKATLRYGFTDYQHQEIEDSTPSTTFTNRQHELRVELTHEPIANWQGAVGYHVMKQQQDAFGEEAYTPASTTEKHGLFWVLERQLYEFNWQLGARLDDVRVNHDSFSPLSASIGFTYPIDTTMQLSANFSHAQRAPSANELYANGAHLATRTYELGLAYELHQEAEHTYHVEIHDAAIDLEKSNNIDFGLHIDSNQFHMDWNLFYNRVDDYVYASFTGINSLDVENEAHEDHTHVDDTHTDHDHGEGLAVVSYVQRDVELYGYELSGYYSINDNWQVHGFSDYVRARTRAAHDNLPRIPAQRIGTEVRYLNNQWEAKLGYTWYNSQTRIATNETTTDGYGLVNAQLNWFPSALSQFNASIYIKAENITNELAFVHSSFLKDDAPMRGRNVSIGLRGEF